MPDMVFNKMNFLKRNTKQQGINMTYYYFI